MQLEINQPVNVSDLARITESEPNGTFIASNFNRIYLLTIEGNAMKSLTPLSNVNSDQEKWVVAKISSEALSQESDRERSQQASGSYRTSSANR